MIRNLLAEPALNKHTQIHLEPGLPKTVQALGIQQSRDLGFLLFFFSLSFYSKGVAGTVPLPFSSVCFFRFLLPFSSSAFFRFLLPFSSSVFFFRFLLQFSFSVFFFRFLLPFSSFLSVFSVFFRFHPFLPIFLFHLQEKTGRHRSRDPILQNPSLLDCECESERKSPRFCMFSSVWTAFAVCMFITKANAKENLGEFSFTFRRSHDKATPLSARKRLQ